MKYQTRFGKTYNLANWPKEHLEFFKKAVWNYWNGLPYEDFISLILGSNSPVLNRKINGPEPTETPLYDVLTDLQFRLGTKQGLFEKDWEGEIDPDGI